MKRRPVITAIYGGRIYSRKNTQVIIKTPNGRTVIVPNNNVRKNIKQLGDAIKQQVPRYIELPISVPIRMTVKLGIKGKYDIDIDNALSLITDALERSGIIENDKLIVSARITKKRNLKDWYTVIKIYTYQ